MTTILKQASGKNYYVELAQEDSTIKVSASPIIKSGDIEYIGFPEREIIYHYSELKKAQATFSRYTKKYIL